jgi:hypothetical protein
MFPTDEEAVAGEVERRCPPLRLPKILTWCNDKIKDKVKDSKWVVKVKYQNGNNSPTISDKEAGRGGENTLTKIISFY